MKAVAALNIPIQMFGACSTLGDITPLWFRYRNKDHGAITMRIENIVSSREKKFRDMEHISFVCWAVAGGQRRLTELRYRISTHKWSFFRTLSWEVRKIRYSTMWM